MTAPLADTAEVAAAPAGMGPAVGRRQGAAAAPGRMALRRARRQRRLAACGGLAILVAVLVATVLVVGVVR